MIARTVVLGVLALGVAGCPTGNNGTPGKPGQFESDVAELQLLKDGRRAKLLKDFAYVDGAGVRWVAPAGEEVDGASIPQVFWTLIGGPYDGKYRFASIVHDRYCRVHEGRTWEAVHLMFYEACLAGGTDPQIAKLMYGAVYHFGPRWGPEGEKGEEALAALVPAERTRMSRELGNWEAARLPTTRAAVRRVTTVPTRPEFRSLALAPRRANVDVPTTAPGVPSPVSKWDRIREFVRQNPDATPAQIQQVQ